MERTGIRLKAFAFLVALMFSALSTRLWFLQVLAAPAAKQAISENTQRSIEVSAPRGVIVDDKGRPIVVNSMSQEVLVNQQQLGSNAPAELHDLGSVVGGVLILPATAETIVGFIDAAESAPEELSTIANVMPLPPIPGIPPPMPGMPPIPGIPGVGWLLCWDFFSVSPMLAMMMT